MLSVKLQMLITSVIKTNVVSKTTPDPLPASLALTPATPPVPLTPNVKPPTPITSATPLQMVVVVA
jgi:hypothetical protein